MWSAAFRFDERTTRRLPKDRFHPSYARLVATAASGVSLCVLRAACPPGRFSSDACRGGWFAHTRRGNLDNLDSRTVVKACYLVGDEPLCFRRKISSGMACLAGQVPELQEPDFAWCDLVASHVRDMPLREALPQKRPHGVVSAPMEAESGPSCGSTGKHWSL